MRQRNHILVLDCGKCCWNDADGGADGDAEADGDVAVVQGCKRLLRLESTRMLILLASARKKDIVLQRFN